MYWSVDDIGLELHEEVVLAGAAVNLQSVQLNAGTLFHGCQNIVGLECQGLQGCTDDVILVDAAGKAGDSASCIRIPVGSAQTCEGRNNIASIGIFYSGCEVLGIRGLVNQLHLVAEPLDSSTCYEYGTFQSVLNLAVKTPCDGGQKAVVRIKRLVADIHQHEAACAVGVLCHTGLEAGLSEQSCLLVACHACDLDRAAEEFRIGLAVYAAGRLCFRQHAHRNFQLLAQLFIPLQCIDIEHQGSGCVGVIRCMYFALGQLVDKPCINGTEAELAGLSLLAHARNIVQDPAKLCAGEVRVKYQTGLMISVVCDARILGNQFVLHISSSAALPYNCVVNRLSGLSVPYDGGLTLVSNTDCSDVLISSTNLLHSLAGNQELCLPDFAGIMLYPAGLRIVLGELLLSNRAHLTLLIEKDTSVAGCTCIQCHYILCHSNTSFINPAGYIPGLSYRSYAFHSFSFVVEMEMAPFFSAFMISSFLVMSPLAITGTRQHNHQTG